MVLSDLSEEKFDAVSVDKFRSILVEKDLLPPSQDNELTMLRFLKTTRLKGRQYNYERATLRWKEMIEWRRKNEVDTIIQDFVYEEHEDVQLCYPHGFHGVDKAGRPIYIRYLAERDCSKLMKVTTTDRFIKSYIQECEKMVVEKFPACSQIANKPIDSTVQIIVIPTTSKEGFKSLMYHNYLAYRIAHIRWTYYPQTDHQIFHITSRKGCGLLSRLLMWGSDPKKRPIGIYDLDQDDKHKLLEFIDEDQLPKFLGGSCSCPGKGGCLRFEKGPWVVPKTVQLDKDKNAEMDFKKRKEIPETMQVIPETVQQPPSGLGSALLPEATCVKCNELENNINVLSTKLDRLQTTIDRLLLPQHQKNN